MTMENVRPKARPVENHWYRGYPEPVPQYYRGYPDPGVLCDGPPESMLLRFT